jgi:hypothetical protein
MVQIERAMLSLEEEDLDAPLGNPDVYKVDL